MNDPYVCVRQRAGPLVKALVTDNYGYLRRYGPDAVRGRCGPALSRTTVDKLELRLALFGYDGVFYTLTFVCVIRLRRTHPELERKYKVPGYPVVPILAIISGVYVIISQLALSGLGNTLLSIGSIVVTLIGLPVYSAAKKRYSK